MWQQTTTSNGAARLGGRPGVRRWRLGVGAALLTLVVVGVVTSLLATSVMAREGGGRVSGAGKTIIEGGTGGATPVPVTTLVAFRANAQGGHFECLALMPSQATGAGSGEFTANAMYVTGRVTSVETNERAATLRGKATVTGIGAGQDMPFTVRVTPGGPGATVVLEVSGLTFREILLEGHISID